MSFPKSKHYKITPGGSGSSGGGAPGGAANAIQTNNGAGGSSGVGDLTATRLKLPAGAGGTGGSGLRIQNGSKDFSDEYLANLSEGYTGGALTTNILDAVNIPDNCVFSIEVNVSAIQTNGTIGATGFGFKLIGQYRKQGTSIFQIGATVEDTDYGFNNTGDVFSGSKTITVNAGNTNINLDFNLTTAKTFRVARWVKIKGVAV